MLLVSPGFTYFPLVESASSHLHLVAALAVIRSMFAWRSVFTLRFETKKTASGIFQWPFIIVE